MTLIFHLSAKKAEHPAASRGTEILNEVQPSRMLVGIGFPIVGCWEITGKYGSDVLTFVVWVTSAQDPCDPRALLPLTDPPYADAMELAETLNRHDISVRCVLLSKEAQMFEGQLGAALSTTVKSLPYRHLPPNA